MKRLGIDIGSLFLGGVLLEDGALTASVYRPHRGDIRGRLRVLLDDERFKSFDLIGVAGSIHGGEAVTIDPTLSVIEGARHLLPGCRNVLSMGGQTFLLIFYDERGEYREHSVNPPCASGTGSFLEQQAERLGFCVEELARKADGYSGKIPGIATRCAVFAKTDIIHAQQEGYSVEAVCAGLCDGIARSLLDGLVKGRELQSPLGVVGGGALNSRIVRAIGEILGKEVLAPPHAECAGAVGAARLARTLHEEFLARGALFARMGTPAHTVDGPGGERAAHRPYRQNPTESAPAEGPGRSGARKPLAMELSPPPDFSSFNVSLNGDVELFLPKEAPARDGGVYAGIDIGSTSTKIALINMENEFVGGFYTSTGGDPISALGRLIGEIDGVLGSVGVQGRSRQSPGGPSLKILGVATTGSGRKLIKSLFRADTEADEITAHARAAVFLNPEADTIIEIGGQDSKFTRLKAGEVYFSAMNYACAAGTGSFIEEQAKRLGVDLAEFSGIAMGFPAPYTSDRCTVYMERDLGVLLGEGWSKRALAAAVLHSVRDNYVAKVVGKSPIGERVVFQGATARNRALIASFEQLLKKPIHVSPYCHLTGAFGAALLCREALADLGEADLSAKKGPKRGVVAGGSSFLWEAFGAGGKIPVSREVCALCANRCLLTVADAAGAASAWGMKCGREYDSSSMRHPRVPAPITRFRDAMKPLMKRARGKKRAVTIGLSPALYGTEYYPLWHAFLTRLGFEVVLAKPGRSSLSDGKGIVNSDFCAPMIAAHGSFKALLDEGADYIFYPAMMNEEDERDAEERLFRKKTRDAYFCYYSQYLPTIVSKLTSIRLEERLISPLLALNGKTVQETAGAIYEEMARVLPDSPGEDRLSREETLAAFTEAHALFADCRNALSRGFGAGSAKNGPGPDLGQDSIGFPHTSGVLPSGGPLKVALLGRPYVVFDPALNLDIPRKLEELGVEVFWQDEFALDGEPLLYANKYYERMHWHFGKKIIRVAEYCARAPNLFAVFLTCFRCSPDSFLISYVKDIMDHYGKPFLILQIDEHSSDVGYTTRIEAALRTFEAHRQKHVSGRGETPPVATRVRNDRLVEGDSVLIPYLDQLISTFWADSFTRAGYRALLLDADEKALSTGYQYASGGECMPLVSIMGGAIEKMRSERLEPEKTFFFLPTSCYACNFPQFPILSDLVFRSAGLEGLKIGLINVMSLGDGLSQGLAAKIFESYIVASVLYKVRSRVRPYEVRAGATDAAFKAARARISEAIRSGHDLRSALSEALEIFRGVERDESGGRKARVALLGDLYVKYNEAVNQDLQTFVEELGGELVIPSMTEYALHYYYADVKHYGDDPRHYTLFRSIEHRYEKLASDLIGDELEPDLAECARLMEERRFHHYIVGETSMTVGRALHEIGRNGVDAVIHVNPIFCCPGVVSSSIFRKVQEDSGVPIVDLFYDGTGSPNRLLIPHLHYLNKGKKA